MIGSKAWMRTALLGSAVPVMVGLTACGGGGSGGAPSSARPLSQQDTRAVTLNLTSENADSAAGLGLSLGDFVLAFAQVEVAAGQAVLAALNTSWSNSCSNGGVVQYTWTDMNGDSLRGVGDTVTVQYTDCLIAQTGSVLTGTVQISIMTKTGKSLGMTVDHGSGLLMVDTDDQSQSRLLGSMDLAWSDDGMTRQLLVSSSARDDLRLTAPYQSGSQVLTDTEQLHGINLRKTLSREHAKATSELNFRLQSDYLGGSFNVSTPVALSSYFDTYPDSGEVNIRGKNSAVVKLKANYASNSSLLSYDFDAEGDGTSDEQRYGAWDQLTTGIMWWGEDFGAQSQFAIRSTKDFASNDFRILAIPFLSGSVGQLPVMAIQFSRELEVGLAPRMQLVRTSYDDGEQYFWGDAVIPVSIQVKGAYAVLTPSQPLQHGLTYTLQPLNANGQPQSTVTYKDKLGNVITDGERHFTVDNSLSAVITLPSHAPLLTTGQSVVLSAASSRASGSIVSYRWTQAAGASVVFSDPDKPATTVTLAGSTSGSTTTTVQLQITDANGQVEYSRKVITVVTDQANSSVLYFRSQPGDYIGRGKQKVILSLDGMFSDEFATQPSYLRYYTNRAGQTDFWMLDLSSGDRLPIRVGAYENAIRAAFSGSNNGLDLSGDGSGCNMLTGRFDVLDIAHDSNGKITRLAVDFEQHCEGMAPALFGSFRYKSSLPVRP